MRQTCDGELKALRNSSTVSIFWGFLIKYFIPVVLAVVLVGTMQTDDEERYEGYERKHLAIGIVIFSCMVAIVFIIGAFPSILKQTSDASGSSEGGTVVSTTEMHGVKTKGTAIQYATSSTTTAAAAATSGTSPKVSKHPVADQSSGNVADDLGVSV